jgi:Flp pilus assembly CpaF family ATPase
VEEILDALVAEPLELAPELSETITAEAFRRAVVDRYLTRPGDAPSSRRAIVRATDWKRDPRHGLFDTTVDRLRGELAPRAAEGTPGERVRRLLDAFDTVYSEQRETIGSDLADLARRHLLRRELGDLVFGLGPLEDLLRLPHLEEIMVVGRDRIFVETPAGIEETGRAFPNDDALEVAIRRIVAPVGRFVNRSRPLVDARLPDGSRVNVVIPPVAVHGPSITIRKFRDRPLTPEDLVRLGTLDRRTLTFLRAAVVARKNVIVSGGTGSGKTTLLNVLASQIPPAERIVVIEDSAELQLRQANLVVLEAKSSNLEGEGEISIRALVRNALRMRPDRIVVGECRGGEALDMLQAMNTGHDGSLTTAHANSPAELMSRLEVMVLEAGQGLPLPAIQRQIADALDLVVQIERQRDHTRRVTSITEVVAHDPEEGRIVLEEVFTLSRRPGGAPPALEFTGYLPSFLEEMFEAAGHGGAPEEDDRWLGELFWPALRDESDAPAGERA